MAGKIATESERGSYIFGIQWTPKIEGSPGTEEQVRAWASKILRVAPELLIVTPGHCAQSKVFAGPYDKPMPGGWTVYKPRKT